MKALTSVPHPRVDERVDDVHHHTDHHHHHGEERHQTLDGDVVASVEVLDQLGPDAGPVEGPLGEHCAGKCQCDLEADHCDHRDQGVAEGVTAYDVALGDAAGPGRFDVVALHRLDDVDPDQADDHSTEQQPEGEAREHMVLEHVGGR